MNKFLKTTTTLLTFSALVACGEDATIDDSLSLGNGKTLESISITGEDFQTEAGTRSSVEVNNAGVNFLWEEGDVVGIFPNTGDQVSFAMDEGIGMQTATFNGGGWALKSSSTYAAYYPHDYNNRDLTAIPVNYEGQAQTGNNSTAHLGAYDFMAASVTTPSNGAVAFDMKHMGALVMLKIDIGIAKAKTFTNVAVKASTEAFTTNSTIDLTAVNPEITANPTISTLNIPLNDFTVAANEASTIYFMLAPTNLVGETLEIILSDEEGEYIKFDVAGKNFIAGTAYAYTLFNKIPEYAVDLGLPSGTLWANRNVGAYAPEAYGDYFAWGEIEPDSVYNWSTYKWCNGTYASLQKYNYDATYGKKPDGKRVLDLEDDAAYVNMGEEWRIPTKTELDELTDNCTQTWTTENGVEGIKMTGPNGNSLFLPAAGRYRENQLQDIGVACFYWTSSLNNPTYTASWFNERKTGSNGIKNNRCFGQSVRAVVRAEVLNFVRK